MISVRGRPSSWMQFLSLFFKSSVTRANNWRSIGQISWQIASFKSFNVGVCECKDAISNTPKGKKITRWKIGRVRGPRHVSETGNKVPGKHVSNNGHWPSLHCYWSGQTRGKECRPPLLPPRPTYWVLPIPKMSGSRGSFCIAWESLEG